MRIRVPNEPCFKKGYKMEVCVVMSWLLHAVMVSHIFLITVLVVTVFNHTQVLFFIISNTSDNTVCSQATSRNLH